MPKIPFRIGYHRAFMDVEVCPNARDDFHVDLLVKPPIDLLHGGYKPGTDRVGSYGGSVYGISNMIGQVLGKLTKESRSSRTILAYKGYRLDLLCKATNDPYLDFTQLVRDSLELAWILKDEPGVSLVNPPSRWLSLLPGGKWTHDPDQLRQAFEALTSPEPESPPEASKEEEAVLPSSFDVEAYYGRPGAFDERIRAQLLGKKT